MSACNSNTAQRFPSLILIQQIIDLARQLFHIAVNNELVFNDCFFHKFISNIVFEMSPTMASHRVFWLSSVQFAFENGAIQLNICVGVSKIDARTVIGIIRTILRSLFGTAELNEFG